MSTELVKVFLTPTKANPNEAELKVFPDIVNLFINVDFDEGGQFMGVDIDDVVWQYVVVPPQQAQMPAFSNAPQPTDVFLEIRLAPRNTPFGPSTEGSASPLNLIFSPDIILEGPIDSDTATYAGNGINPLVPNKPRLDAAPPPENQFTESDESLGASREYKYAVVLTTASQVYTLDPKLIITRRHRRSRSDN
jgi:hypothetical protein